MELPVGVAEIYLNYGVLGATIMILFVVAWRQWVQNDRLQERRVEELKSALETVNKIVATLDTAIEVASRSQASTRAK
jgi:Flp pilus assembly protein TadB